MKPSSLPAIDRRGDRCRSCRPDVAIGADACPFCTAPQATLAERRDAAEIVALAEWAATKEQHERLRVLKLFK